MKIDDQVGFIEQASYFVKRQSGVVTPADDQPATGFAAPRPLGMQPRQPAVKTAQKVAAKSPRDGVMRRGSTLKARISCA